MNKCHMCLDQPLPSSTALTATRLELHSGMLRFKKGDVDIIRDTLRRASILCKKSSTHFTDNTQLGDDSKACNGVVDSIFQFYVGSKSSDITDEKDMNTAILDLYKDISEIISSVEVESYRNELILWSVEDT